VKERKLCWNLKLNKFTTRDRDSRNTPPLREKRRRLVLATTTPH
jgi:hypothetical protein